MKSWLLSSILLSSLVLNMSAFWTGLQIDGPKPSKLSTTVPDFFLSSQTIFDGVSELNSESLPLVFGFEAVLKEKFDGPSIPDQFINLSLKDATVKEILDALCKADPRYTWSLDGSTVNVYPRETAQDPSYLLNRRLEKLDIKNITDIDEGLLAIAHQLPPPQEQLAHAQMGGDAAYPSEPWSTTFEKLTVRQAVNRLSGHMGGHSAWLFYGSREFRAFSFFRLGFRKPVR
jgi:hypothetical protein